MTEHTFLGATMIAFFCFLGFACWLMARYGGGGRTAKREPYYTRTTVTFQPRGGIETAPTRKPKPVPPVRPVQPNRRKKKKARK